MGYQDNPSIIELSENRRSLSLSLSDLKANFLDVLSRNEHGLSPTTEQTLVCGEIELDLVENRNSDGSPFTFVVLNRTAESITVWCDHSESIGSHQFGIQASLRDYAGANAAIWHFNVTLFESCFWDKLNPL